MPACIAAILLIAVTAALSLHSSSQSSKPVPTAVPASPAETSDSLIPGKAEEDGELFEKAEQNLCTLMIRCDTVLANIDKLQKEKQELVPANGILYQAEDVEFSEGETVFDVLQKEMKKNKIQIDYSGSPASETVYIKGIGNLYAGDLGGLSGWMCKVNGEFIQAGCSQYKLSAGDMVDWMYTCDAGRDIGAETVED